MPTLPRRCQSTLRLLLTAAVVTAACALPRSLDAASTSDTIARVLPRMVKIFGAGGLRGLAAYSTGFLVSPEGHIVTAWNHVLDPGEVTVILNDGRRLVARVVGAEPKLNVAVLKIDSGDRTLNLPYFDLDRSIATASEGTRILAFSNMFKVATGDEPVSVLHGVIAARTKLKARRGTFEVPFDGPVYVVDAITNNSGAAGGLLTTRDGRLLGMIGRELRNAETNTWINYSVPLTALKESIQEIISGNFKSSRDRIESPDETPRRYSPLDFGLVMVPNVLARTPAFVDDVVKGSPAAQADIRPDDLVVFVNDELIQSLRQLSDALGRLEAGDRLRLVLQRGEDLNTVEFTAPRKPSPAADRSR